MNIRQIDHIGVAVADLDKYLAIFGDLVGLEVHDFEKADPYEGLRIAFARIGEVDFEFLEDRAPELNEKLTDQRDISRCIDKRGEGIHHIGLRVSDIQAAIDDCKSKGLLVLDEKGRPRARGSKVAFIHPKSTGGHLPPSRGAVGKSIRATILPGQ